MLDIEPLDDVIIVKQETLVKKDGKDHKTEGGIILPEEAIKGGSFELFEGTVLKTGPKCSKVVKGDRILFGKHCFSVIERNGEEYLAINEREIKLKVQEAS